jgi:uncharacterized radical SAM superfamily Fe-S cluster-containing enzyme
MKTLGQTTSACPVCRALVPAKIFADGEGVRFATFCPEHGEARSLVRRDVAAYLGAQRNVKAAWVPREFATDVRRGCPEDCGFCPRHEQHLCLPILEITSRCDLTCPACLVSAGGGWDMSLGDFNRVLDGLLRAERQLDVLNLSGGEPLLHPQLLALVDAALARPEIVRISISTNGLRLFEDLKLLRELQARKVVVSLQFDGFDERAYQVLRGRSLLEKKRRILERLAESGTTTSLTMTVAGGVNEQQLRPVLDYLFAHDHVVSLMLQPLAFVGRGAQLAGTVGRLTLCDVVRAVGAAGHPAVSAGDFLPLPCSHPLCFSLAFYLKMDDGRAVSVARLAQGNAIRDVLANRTIFGLDAEEHERLKQMVYELWSGPAGSVPEGEAVLKTLRGLLRELSCGCFEPRAAFSLAERRVKSIFVHAFQDAGSFDLARVRRCCNAYPQPDGRLVPACVQNVLRRGR